MTNITCKDILLIKRYTNEYTKVQHARTHFDIDVDFTEAINWNNNVTFMWITAQYKTGKKNELTKMTVYDKVILRSNPQDHHVVLKNQIFEYPLIDTYKSLR